MNKIIVSSGSFNSGFLHFDFDQKQVVFDSESGQTLQFKLNKKVDFSKITGIELKTPGMITGGQVIFIIDNIRYKDRDYKFACEFSFNVDKANFTNLNVALKRLSNETNIAIKGINGYSATEKTYMGEYTIVDKKESNELTNTEHRKRCNVCGKIICYTLKDIEDNQRRAKGAAWSAVGGIAGGLSGNYAAGAISNQTAEQQLNNIVDYNKCPQCGSRDLVDISEDSEVCANALNNEQPTVSSADELKKFKELLDMGAITQEEFDAKKKQLLGL